MDKPAKPHLNASMFPVCHDCPHRQLQTDWIDPKGHSYVHGCNLLDQAAWNTGAAKDSSGTIYQKNCPKRLDVEKKS
jgi:hypothetical protein